MCSESPNAADSPRPTGAAPADNPRNRGSLSDRSRDPRIQRPHPKTGQHDPGGRGGYRQPTVGRVDRTAAHRQGRKQDPVDSQIVNGQGEAQDIHNRIHGSDLVKMHLVNGNAVHPALRFSQSPEDAPAGRHDRLRILSAAQQVECGGQISILPLAVLPPGDRKLHAGPAGPTLASLSDLQSRDLQLTVAIPEIVQGDPEIDQRCEDHVSAGPAEQLEVEHEALYTATSPMFKGEEGNSTCLFPGPFVS
jgi:hypothetical protein